MGEGALGGVGIARLLVPADVLKRRDAHDQVEALVDLELEHIGVDHSRRSLVPIEHRVTDASVVRENVSDLQHTTTARGVHDGPDDRDLDRAFVQPRVVVTVRKILIARAAVGERRRGRAEYDSRYAGYILRQPARGGVCERDEPLGANRGEGSLANRRRPVGRPHFPQELSCLIPANRSSPANCGDTPGPRACMN